MTSNIKINNWGAFMLSKLTQLFLQEVECDITIMFSDRSQIKAHKVILAAASGFFGEYLEKNPKRNAIMLPPEFQSNASMAIIQFMYSGRLDVREEMMGEILGAVQLFDIPDLEKLLMSYTGSPQELRRGITLKPEVAIREKPQIASLRFLNRKVDEAPRPTRFSGPAFSLNPTDVSGEMTYNALTLETQMSSPSPSITSFRSSPALRRKNSDTLFDELKASAAKTRKFGSLEGASTPRRIGKEDLNEMREFSQEQRLRKEQLLDEDDHHAESEDDFHHFEDDDDVVQKPSSQFTRAENAEGRDIPKTVKELEVTIIQGSTPTSSVITLYNENHEILMSKELAEAPLEINIPNKLIGEILKSVPELVLEHSSVQLKIVRKYMDQTNRKMKTRISKVALRASTTDKPPVKTEPPSTLPPPEPETEQKAMVGDLKVSPFEIRNGPWICQTCTDQAGSDCRMTLYYDWREHLIDIHGFTADPNVCEFCGFKALKRIFMVYHQYVVHHVPTDDSIYFAHCCQCDYIGVNTAAMKRHLSVHSAGLSLCRTCSCTFASPEDLRLHIEETRHTKYGTGYLCPVCNFQFDTDSTLKEHIDHEHKNYAAKLAEELGFPVGLGHPFPSFDSVIRNTDAVKLEEGQQTSENGGFGGNASTEFVGLPSDLPAGSDISTGNQEGIMQSVVEDSEENSTVLMANSTIINPDGSLTVMLEGSDTYTIIPADSYRYTEDGSLQILQD
ncbi:centrosome-associated zinc finger protein Cp190-like isoform X2 [Artemia franciscana]|uniref:Uncharacterized protein n=1 Tax=Artemia franciscana TaxID=6661 RepID=A0AA88LED8_ARTSF|nr:hypothetical protein QYM36_003859 [Artemia franciscana]